jgi:hypothetical protein
MLSCYAIGNITTPGQVGGALVLPTPAPESTTSGNFPGNNNTVPSRKRAHGRCTLYGT